MSYNPLLNFGQWQAATAKKVANQQYMNPDQGFYTSQQAIDNGLFNLAPAGAVAPGGQTYFGVPMVPGRASGGPVRAGQMTKVGERGPEMLHTKGGNRIVGKDGPDYIHIKTEGYVTPNERLMSMPRRERMMMGSMPKRLRYTS
jgi:hypothetical protein